MTRVIRGSFSRFAPASLFVTCAFAVLTYGATTIADDSPPPETAPPPPSLAPESAAPPAADAAPPSKQEAEDVFKTPAESPEPSTPTEASSEEKKSDKEKEETPAIPQVTAEESVALPAENNEDKRQDNIIEAKREGRVPVYQTTHPAWGFEMAGTVGALGGGNIENSQNGSLARGLEMQFEYQLPFLQTIGVISFGPSFVLYPIGADGSVTANPYSIWAAGGQVRYQARFIREQVVVPMIGYEAQKLTYHFVDGAQGATPLQGAYFGAMILLNWFEPSAASESYVENGISRSYITAEYKVLSASDNYITVGGGSLFLGFRLEF